MTKPVGEIFVSLVDGKVVVERADRRVRVTGELVRMRGAEGGGKIQVGEYTYKCVETGLVTDTAIYERED